MASGKKFLSTFLPLAVLGLIILFLLGRLHLGFIRFFDQDEMSNANWIYLVSRGYIPYRDFFYYYTPLFHWLLAPVFFLPEGPYLAIMLRIIIWVVYAGLIYLLYKLVYQLSQKKLISLLTCLIFISFPLTFDKTIDVRPDTLMTLLFFTAIYVLYTAKRLNPRLFFVAGLLVGASSLVFLKIIFAFPALLFILLSSYKGNLQEYLKKHILPFVTGFCLPFGFFVIYLLLTGSVLVAWKDIFRGSLVYNFSLGITFSFSDVLGPWPLIYLQKGGITLPWLVQMSIWILGILGIPIVVIWRQRFGIFMLIYIFFAFLFLFAFRRPFVQYFIPLSLIFSINIAFLFQFLLNLFKPFYLLILLFTALLAASFFLQYHDRTLNLNSQQLEVLEQVHEHIPQNEPVVDLVGSFIYRPAGFLYNVPSYDLLVDALDPNYPTLSQVLAGSQVKYLVMDQKGFIFWTVKPDDLTFILTHYLLSPWFKIYTPGAKFVCDQSICFQYNLHDLPAFNIPSNNFSLHIKGNYQLTTDPKGEMVILNGEKITDGEIKKFNPSSYTFTVSENLHSFILQYSQ